VRGDASALVSEQILTILEANARSSQPPSERVLEVVHPRLKPSSAGSRCASDHFSAARSRAFFHPVLFMPRTG